MKRIIAELAIISVLVAGGSVFAATIPATTSGVPKSVPVTGSSLTVSSSTKVSTYSSMYVVSDSVQQNTCYVLLAGTLATGISCIADHIYTTVN